MGKQGADIGMNWRFGVLNVYGAIVLAVLALGTSMSAYAGLFGYGGSSWKEEALLHDGRKIVVERTVERGGRHEVGQKPAYTLQTLRATHPETGANVFWEDKATPDLGTSSFLLMALDIHEGTVYLVANPMGCLSYNKWGRPNPPYVVFRLNGNSWSRIPLSELPSEIKVPNLIISSPDTEVEELGKRFVDSATVAQLNEGFRQPEYKSILREPSPGAGRGCIRSDYYGKAGWLSQDWFADQPSINACLEFCSRKQIDTHACPCRKFHNGEK